MSRDPKQIIQNAKRVSNHATSDDMRGENGESVYIPYETSGNRQGRLHIMRYDAPMHYPDYRYLMNITHTGEGNQFVLLYSFLMVKVTGEHLGELIEHIAQGTAVFLQQFDAQQWEQPKEGTPIIKSIEVVGRNDSNELALDEKKRPKPTLVHNELH